MWPLKRGLFASEGFLTPVQPSAQGYEQVANVYDHMNK